MDVPFLLEVVLLSALMTLSYFLMDWVGMLL